MKKMMIIALMLGIFPFLSFIQAMEKEITIPQDFKTFVTIAPKIELKMKQSQDGPKTAEETKYDELFEKEADYLEQIKKCVNFIEFLTKGNVYPLAVQPKRHCIELLANTIAKNIGTYAFDHLLGGMVTFNGKSLLAQSFKRMYDISKAFEPISIEDDIMSHIRNKDLREDINNLNDLVKNNREMSAIVFRPSDYKAERHRGELNNFVAIAKDLKVSEAKGKPTVVVDKKVIGKYNKIFGRLSLVEQVDKCVDFIKMLNEDELHGREVLTCIIIEKIQKFFQDKLNGKDFKDILTDKEGPLENVKLVSIYTKISFEHDIRDKIENPNLKACIHDLDQLLSPLRETVDAIRSLMSKESYEEKKDEIQKEMSLPGEEESLTGQDVRLFISLANNLELEQNSAKLKATVENEEQRSSKDSTLKSLYNVLFANLTPLQRVYKCISFVNYLGKSNDPEQNKPHNIEVLTSWILDDLEKFEGYEKEAAIVRILTCAPSITSTVQNEFLLKKFNEFFEKSEDTEKKKDGDLIIMSQKMQDFVSMANNMELQSIDDQLKVSVRKNDSNTEGLYNKYFNDHYISPEDQIRNCVDFIKELKINDFTPRQRTSYTELLANFIVSSLPEAINYANDANMLSRVIDILNEISIANDIIPHINDENLKTAVLGVEEFLLRNEEFLLDVKKQELEEEKSEFIWQKRMQDFLYMAKYMVFIPKDKEIVYGFTPDAEGERAAAFYDTIFDSSFSAQKQIRTCVDFIIRLRSNEFDSQRSQCTEVLANLLLENIDLLALEGEEALRPVIPILREISIIPDISNHLNHNDHNEKLRKDMEMAFEAYIGSDSEKEKDDSGQDREKDVVGLFNYQDSITVFSKPEEKEPSILVTLNNETTIPTVEEIKETVIEKAITTNVSQNEENHENARADNTVTQVLETEKKQSPMPASLNNETTIPTGEEPTETVIGQAITTNASQTEENHENARADNTVTQVLETEEEQSPSMPANLNNETTIPTGEEPEEPVVIEKAQLDNAREDKLVNDKKNTESKQSEKRTSRFSSLKKIVSKGLFIGRLIGYGGYEMLKNKFLAFTSLLRSCIG